MNHLGYISTRQVQKSLIDLLFFAFIIILVYVVLIYILDFESMVQLSLVDITEIFAKSVVEEYIFRFLLLTQLLKIINNKSSLLVSSFIFSFCHLIDGSHTNDTYLFFLHLLGGLLYGYLFIETKSLVLPVLLHFSWNISCNLLPWNDESYTSENLSILVSAKLVIFSLTMLYFRKPLEHKKVIPD